MKKYPMTINFIIIVVLAIISGRIKAEAATSNAISQADREAIAGYVSRNYDRSYKIKVRQAGSISTTALEHRAEKHVIYIEVFQTRATSKHSGRCTTAGRYHDCYFRYPHTAKRGEKVKVYLIYNPDTNYTDDVVAVVSGGSIRE
jgi:hypothetical protein